MKRQTCHEDVGWLQYLNEKKKLSFEKAKKKQTDKIVKLFFR